MVGRNKHARRYEQRCQASALDDAGVGVVPVEGGPGLGRHTAEPVPFLPSVAPADDVRVAAVRGPVLTRGPFDAGGTVRELSCWTRQSILSSRCRPIVSLRDPAMSLLSPRRRLVIPVIAMLAGWLAAGCQNDSERDKPDLDRLDAVDIVRPADVDGGSVERPSLRSPHADVRRFADVDASPDPFDETDCSYGGSDNLACGVVEIDSDLDTICALVRTGRVVCWGDVHRPEKEGPIGNHDGTGPDDVWFVDIDVGDDHTCGVTWQGAVRCWGDGVRGAPGRFTDVWAGDQTTCAKREEGWIQCWGGGIPSPDQSLRAVRLHDHGTPKWGCGLDGDGRVVCWGQTDHLDAGPGAGYRDFVLLDGAICGLDEAGDVECNETLPFVEFSGPYRDVDSDGFENVCAVGTDGATECWSTDGDDFADEPSQRMRSVTVEHDYACGITHDFEVECWGEGARRPPD